MAAEIRAGPVTGPAMGRRDALLLVDRLKRRTRDPDVLTLCEYVRGTDVHGTIPAFRRPDVPWTQPAVRDPDVLTLCEYVRGTDVHGTIPAFRRPDVPWTQPAVMPSALCPVCAAQIMSGKKSERVSLSIGCNPAPWARLNSPCCRYAPLKSCCASAFLTLRPSRSGLSRRIAMWSKCQTC